KDAYLRLRGDAVGPLLAGRLLGDLPRALLAPLAWAWRQLPWSDAARPAGGDSAEAIERAFEHLWQPTVSGGSGRSFAGPFLALSYRADGSTRRGVPVWLANGTDAATGNRVLTVPFAPPGGVDATACPGWPIRGARSALDLLDADVRVSTAINNTARFPFL